MLVVENFSRAEDRTHLVCICLGNHAAVSLFLYGVTITWKLNGRIRLTLGQHCCLCTVWESISVFSLSLLQQHLLASRSGWVSLPELKNELTVNLPLVINVSLR